MTTTVTVLVGSLRADSVNRKLAETLSVLAPEGVELRIAENLDQLPFYNEDIDVEGSVPAAAVKLREAAQAADAFLASCVVGSSWTCATAPSIAYWTSSSCRSRRVSAR